MEILVRTVMEMSRPYWHRAEMLLERAGALPDPASSLFDRIWPKVREWSIIDRFRAQSIFRHVEDSLLKSGDLVECGVFNGGTSLMIACALKELGARKKILLCDSFSEGLSEPRPDKDKGFREGQFAENRIREVEERIDLLGVGDYCEIKPGWFVDTLPQLSADQEFCLVHVDCDLYEPALECLEYLYPKLVTGGVMIFDDYLDHSGGIARAVHGWVSESKEVIFLGPVPQGAIYKGLTESEYSEDIPLIQIEEDGKVVYLSFAHLAENGEYRAFLDQVAHQNRTRLSAYEQYISLCKPTSANE